MGLEEVVLRTYAAQHSTLAAANPILADGQQAIVRGLPGNVNNVLYSGDGSTPYNSLIPIASKGLNSNLTVTVGSGGDFSTINAALAYLSRFYPLYKSGGFTATVQLLSGFVMAEQVILRSVNLGFVYITSVDAEVTIQRSALTIPVAGRYAAFIGYEYAVLPKINVLFNMDSSAHASPTNCDGVYVRSFTQLYLYSGAGFKNVSGKGLYAVVSSTIYAGGIILDNIGNNGIEANYSAIVDITGGSVTNCGGSCIYALRHSRVNADTCILTGGTNNGIVAQRHSSINANGSNCQKGASPSSTDIVVSDLGIIEASGATGGMNQTVNVWTASGFIAQ